MLTRVLFVLIPNSLGQGMALLQDPRVSFRGSAC